MELNTDDIKMISREEYRKEVEKIMHKEMRHASMGATMFLIKYRDELDVDEDTLNKIEEATKDALKLQLSVLRSMEEALFGKENHKKDEEKTDD